MYLTDISMVTSLGMGLNQCCTNALCGISRTSTLDFTITNPVDSKEIEPVGHTSPFSDGYSNIGKILRLLEKSFIDIDWEKITSKRLGIILVVADSDMVTKSSTIEEYINYSFDEVQSKVKPDLLEQRLKHILPEKCNSASIKVLTSSEDGFLTGLYEIKSQMSSNNFDCGILSVVDSVNDQARLQWLLDHKRLLTEDKKDGLIPGEAAVTAIIEKTNSGSDKIMNYKVTFEQEYFSNNSFKNGRHANILAHQMLNLLNSDVIDEEKTVLIHDMNGEYEPAMSWGNAQVSLTSSNKAFNNIDTEYPVTFWGDTGICKIATGVGYAAFLLKNRNTAYDEIPITTNTSGGTVGTVLLKRS